MPILISYFNFSKCHEFVYFKNPKVKGKNRVFPIYFIQENPLLDTNVENGPISYNQNEVYSLR